MLLEEEEEEEEERERLGGVPFFPVVRLVICDVAVVPILALWLRFISLMSYPHVTHT